MLLRGRICKRMTFTNLNWIDSARYKALMGAKCDNVTATFTLLGEHLELVRSGQNEDESIRA